MTIDELKRRCDNDINLMAWACGVKERQMRNYLEQGVLPVQRAALAALRVKESQFKHALKANKKTNDS